MMMKNLGNGGGNGRSGGKVATIPTNPMRGAYMANGGKVGVGKGPVKSTGKLVHPATASNVLGGGRDSYRK
jgi:hypothetical protein